MATTRLGREQVVPAERQGVRSEATRWILRGVLMGIAAGGVFLIFEMAVAGLGGQSIFDPLRMIAAVVLGVGALPIQPAVGLFIVVPVALSVHYALSAIYGAVFGAAVAEVGALRQDRLVLVGAATVFGVLLWFVNFYVIAPTTFPWFSRVNPAVHGVAYAIFGAALGLSLAWRPGRRSEQ